MKKSSTKLDKPLLVVMILLMVFGLIMVLSASSMASYMRYHTSTYHFFIKQAIFMTVGLIIFFITLSIPTNFFKKISPALMVILILSLFGLMVYGSAFNSTQGWYDLKIITVQPSEFAKVFIILYLAYYYGKHKADLDNPDLIKLVLPLIPCAICFITIAMQPDLGTAIVIGIITFTIFYSIPIKSNTKKLLNKILIVAGICFVLYLILTKGGFLRSYQLKRLTGFINPCERYEEETGYQLCNSFIAFRNGKLTGAGIGESTQKYLYLPESHTDFIFPIVVEEWGAIGGIIVISLYAFMLIRILNIAKKATNLGNSIIAYGVFVYIFLHIIINLVGVLGLGPLTGIPLPFLSYGGSYTLILLFSMGLVQRVHYENYKKGKK